MPISIIFIIIIIIVIIIMVFCYNKKTPTTVIVNPELNTNLNTKLNTNLNTKLNTNNLNTELNTNLNTNNLTKRNHFIVSNDSRRFNPISSGDYNHYNLSFLSQQVDDHSCMIHNNNNHKSNNNNLNNNNLNHKSNNHKSNNHKSNFTTKENPVYPSQLAPSNNMWKSHDRYPAVYDRGNQDHLIKDNKKSNFSEFNYPGSIDNEIPNLGLSRDRANNTPPFLGFGFKDLAKNENARSPEGNPFNLMNTSAPVAAPIQIDDEANADTIDYDEMNTYHAKWRNDATRATAGTMNRFRNVDPYLREELDETENEVWWGQNEI